MIGPKKYSDNFFQSLPYNNKNIIIVWINQAHQAALEKVDNNIIPYNHHRTIQSFGHFLYNTSIKNNGQNTTKKNHKLIGLSNKN